MVFEDLITNIRQIIEKSEINFDKQNGHYILPTHHGFFHDYLVSEEKGHGLEHTGKIIMPHEAFEELSSMSDLEKSDSDMFSNGNENVVESKIMTFEISKFAGKRSFVGVESFLAPKGTAIIPDWILKNINFDPSHDEKVILRKVILPKGTHLVLQPLNNDFLKIKDTKEMLEESLRKFVCLSVGDNIEINYDNEKFSFEVIDVKPGRAICCINADIDTEFLPAKNSPTPSLSTDSTTTTNSTPTNTTNTSTTKPVPNGKILGSDLINVEGAKICSFCEKHILINNFELHEINCRKKK